MIIAVSKGNLAIEGYVRIREKTLDGVELFCT
jgi:hypothetical protein